MRFGLSRVLVGALLVSAGVASSVLRDGNNMAHPSFLDSIDSIESTTLLCGALDAGTSPLNGVVTFANSGSAMRHLSAVISDGNRSVAAAWSVAGHDALTIRPADYLSSTNITVRAVVDGGGVSGVTRTSVGPTSVVPCRSRGASSWTVTGLRSKNGAIARVVVMNPTSTPSVINVATWSSNGYQQPAPFQGLVVPPVSQVTLNLSNYIVEATDISAAINVLRGRVVSTGMQIDGRNGSLLLGQEETATTQWYPAVPTDDAENVTLNVFNPRATSADIRIALDIPGYSIAPLRVTVPSGSSHHVVVPNSRIPSSGLASIKVTSRVAVATSVELSRANYQRLMSPPPLSHELSWVGSSGIPEAMRLVSDADAKVTFHYAAGHQPKTVTIAVVAGHAITPPKEWRDAGRGVVTSSAGMTLTAVFANAAFESALDPGQ